jgi:hypothetical protein
VTREFEGTGSPSFIVSGIAKVHGFVHVAGSFTVTVHSI